MGGAGRDRQGILLVDGRKPEPASLLKDGADIVKAVPNLAADFLRSVGHSAIQTPLDGLSQLTNQVAGKEILPQIHVVDAPRRAEFGTFNWHLQQVGGAIGLVLPFGVLNKGVKGVGSIGGRAVRFAGLGKALESPLSKAALPILEAGTTGAAFEGLLRPVQPGEGDFWSARGRNAIAGAATFSTLQAASMGLKGVSTWRHAKDSPWLINSTRHDLGRHMVAGGFAGLVDAEVRSQLSGKGHADFKSLSESAYGFMWVGGALRGSKWAMDNARGRSSMADIVARDPSLKSVVRDSPTAKGLLAALGDVPVERVSGSKTGDVSLRQSLTGQHTVQISDQLFRSADPIGRTQLLVEGMAGVETARSIPLTWRHALRESAYAGMMMTRAKTATAREINFVKELEQARGSDASVGAARERTVHRWSQVAELNGMDARFRADYQARFSPWVQRAASLPLLRSLIERMGSRTADKEHLLALREFDAKMLDTEAREKYKEDMGPAAGRKADGTTRDTSATAVESGRPPTDVIKNEKLDRVIDLIPENAQVIVDMGAGGGQFTRALKARRPCAEVVALDLSGEMVSGLKNDRAGGPVDYRVQHGDAMLPDFPPHSVDVITGNSHTHEILSYPDVGHGHYRVEHLTEMFRNYGQMLKPGGRLLIQDFIVPRYGSYNGEFRIMFKTPEARMYFEDFMRELGGQGTHNLPHVKPAPEFKPVADSSGSAGGGVQGSAAAAGELLISSTYGMRMQKYGWPENIRGEYDGVLQEKFANLTSDGMASMVKETAPDGHRMDILRQNTYTSPDYLEHWAKHFEVQVQGPDGRWTPITDMNNFHTRIVLGAEKVPTPNNPLEVMFGFPRTLIPGLARPEGQSIYARVSPGSVLGPMQLQRPASINVDNQTQPFIPENRIDDDRRKRNRSTGGDNG